MLLLFCLLGLVASEPMLRSDLHNLKRLEHERRNKEIINEGFSYIQNEIIRIATAGETKSATTRAKETRPTKARATEKRRKPTEKR